MSNRSAGFGMIELLVTLAITGILMLALTTTFLGQSRAHARQDLSVSMEENLRVAMMMINDSLRTSRYAAPSSDFLKWFPWMVGTSFVDVPNQNPLLIPGTGTDPDSFMVAGCFRQPVALLSAAVNPGDADLSVTALTDPGETLDDLVDTANNRLIRVGDRDPAVYAHVTAVIGNTITIDTEPADPDNDPLTTGYPADTPICRIDVLTFDLDVDPTTGVRRLRFDRNQGAGPQIAAGGIHDLQIVAETLRRYRITIESRSEQPDPVQRAFLRHTLVSHVTLRN